MIAVKNLTRRYGNFTAVDNISFQVEKGAIFGFVGPNGAGKTTTMRIMATLLAPTSGDIEIEGYSVLRSPKEIRKIIGYMPDFFGVYDDLRVYEYLEFYGEAAGCSIAEVRAAIPSLLELVGLPDRKEVFVNNLSRGMKQRLCLARALIHRPRVLILDEPASGLDPRARVELRNILKELQRMGHTIVISSHILAELAQLCTHIGLISNGRIYLCAPIDEALARMQGELVIEVGVLERREEARQWLLEQPGVGGVSISNRGMLEVLYTGGQEEQARLLAETAARFKLYSFTPTGNNLEELFMKITEEGNDEN
ncbi:MAG TPA: ABC transporter ATP-binding protein [Bacillota bacterium]|jgi:ABC-2 type transport system ATP-binding protein|nr:ABC transporter ATP-binding protein [Bacillota bacterium]HOB86205.1 ABC transporter ATP-binding protein [Bacillota bacterium]HOP68142.1 ABC transporter ATP-binding protein [Bacillota bacterium]HPZ64129.1 ABC transporter ATP-binding protein [Bacillota bacterium]HQD06353.1 ABC transporter ATP-binding protein [Bacillota bacterium]